MQPFDKAVSMQRKIGAHCTRSKMSQACNVLLSNIKADKATQLCLFFGQAQLGEAYIMHRTMPTVFTTQWAVSVLTCDDDAFQMLDDAFQMLRERKVA